MPPSKIQADYDSLSGTADNFSQQASTTAQLLQQVQSLVQALQSGGWTGVGANAFFSEMEDLVFPALHRLSSALDNAECVTQKISQILREAEEAASRCFEGDFWGYNRGGAEYLPYEVGEPLNHHAEVMDLLYGSEGYTVVPGARSSLNLVYQVGGTCLLYAMINMLNASGETISQFQANGWLAEIRSRRPPSEIGRQGFTADELNWFMQANNIWGMRFDDAASAENSLIRAIEAGVPIAVALFPTRSFPLTNIPGTGHMCTVIGIKKNADGRLDHVIVQTNWESCPYYNIPAQDFLQDWADGDFTFMVRADLYETISF
jgi:WXG100 family type VII secretion target